MDFELRTRRILYLNALGVIGGLVLFVLVNLYFLHHNTRRLEQIEDVYIKKSEFLSKMMLIVRERTLTMMGVYLADDPWIRDEQVQQFAVLARDFISARDNLLSYSLSEAELAAYERVMKIIRQTEPLQEDIIDRIIDGGGRSLRHDIVTVDLPLEQALLQAFEELITISRDEYHLARAQAQAAYLHAFFITAALALFLSFAVFVIERIVTRRVQAIEAGLLLERASLSQDIIRDVVTAVFNRRWLSMEFQRLREMGRAETMHALLYIDLDNFKMINDAYGHGVGDEYLRAAVRCMESHIRKQDQVVRLGGDEFAVLLQTCDHIKANYIAESIRACMNTFELNNQLHVVQGKGCSIGLISFSASDADMEIVLHAADEACITSKRSGKNQITVASS